MLVATVAVLLGAPPAPAARAKPATQPVPPRAAGGRRRGEATGRRVLRHGV
jgi:hypothetical protein